MTNEALQAMIDAYGKRINMIVLDNNVKILIGYQSSNVKEASELSLETFGETDMFGLYTPAVNPNDKAKGVTATMWYPTGIIQAVCIMDETAGDYLLDPVQFG